MWHDLDSHSLLSLLIDLFILSYAFTVPFCISPSLCPGRPVAANPIWMPTHDTQREMTRYVTE